MPRETVRIITHFSDYADPVKPYMFHCHILEHEDAGMMFPELRCGPPIGPVASHTTAECWASGTARQVYGTPDGRPAIYFHCGLPQLLG